jgi:type IV secretion system protein VirB10
MAGQAIGPQVPPKPFTVSKWLIGAFLIFVIGYFILSFIQHRISTPGASSDSRAAQQAPPSAPASRTDIDGFSRAQSQRLLELAKKRALMSKEIEAAGLGQVEVLDIVNQLPACNKAERDSLRGQTYVAVNQKTHQLVQFACETDDSWHPLPVAANNIPPPTPQQAGAMNPPRHAGGDGMTAKERKADALQKALASSSVVDFALPQQTPQTATPTASTGLATDAKLVSVADRPGEPGTSEGPRTKEKYPWNSYTGKLYHLFAGIPIGSILTNRLSGEFTGPVNLMITTDVYSLDRQHVLIPQGTRVLGEARRVDVSGQRRLVVLLHRLIMDDGYSVDLDNALGLDQVGAAGLTGRVNSHWAKVILTAGAVGALGGLSEIGASSTSLTGLGAMRLGVAQQSGQSATQILDRALNILPTITVYEGSPVVVYIQGDLDLPARENHTIPSNL